MKTTVEIPEDRMAELEPYRDRLGEILLLGLSQMRIREALLLLERGAISLGRAAETARLSREEMVREARAAGLLPMWDEAVLRSELNGDDSSGVDT